MSAAIRPALQKQPVSFELNGRRQTVDVEPRRLLADVLRQQLDHTDVHIGCEAGACGSCTVLLNDQPVRACTVLAVQCDGQRLATVEGMTRDGLLDDLRAAFLRHSAIQCGFCTPGMLVAAYDLLHQRVALDRAGVANHMAGNLCRCTGYEPIVNAILEVARARGGAVGQSRKIACMETNLLTQR